MVTGSALKGLAGGPGADIGFGECRHLGLLYGPIIQRRPAQCSPILPLAAGDDVVNGGQGELLMGEVTV
jgi:hypothetical protein